MKADKCRKCGQWRNNCDWKYNDGNYDMCDPCYSQEHNEKYYDNCKKCHQIENKGFLKEHEYLCGVCSGVLREGPCPTCGHDGYY